MILPSLNFFTKLQVFLGLLLIPLFMIEYKEEVESVVIAASLNYVSIKKGCGFYAKNFHNKMFFNGIGMSIILLHVVH